MDKGRMRSEPTPAKVVDHCDRFERWNVLSGFAVEDSDMIQITEVSDLHLVPGPMNSEIGLFGENKDFVVPLDVKLNLGLASLPVDTSDGEVIDAVDLWRGDHGQIHHGFCESGETRV